MSIIDQAINHYANQERLVISVPEWGTKDNPLQIHVFPMTMAEVNMIQRMSKKDSSNIEHAANIIVIKARDSEGNRLFTLEDKDTLMQKTDYRVIAKITEAIEARFFSDVETHKGNLRNSVRFSQLMLAYRLGYSIAEVEKMKTTEFFEWTAFFELLNQQQNHQYQINRQHGKSR